MAVDETDLHSTGNHRVKRQPMKWEKILVNHISNKGLMCIRVCVCVCVCVCIHIYRYMEGTQATQ
jgi:hypothetical protein